MAVTLIPPTSPFPMIFDMLIKHEGRFSDDPNDRGNWTSGRVGVGSLKGTMFGVSAMSYPHLDIRNLTIPDVRAIYETDYWTRTWCDRMHPMIGLLVFDSAVNNGRGNAVRFLQQALNQTVKAKLAEDGAMGPKTLEALASVNDLLGLCQTYQVIRLRFMASLSTWPRYGEGWAVRLVKLSFQCMVFNTPDYPTPVLPAV